MNGRTEITPRHWVLMGLVALVLLSLVASMYHFREGWTRTFRMGMIYWPSQGWRTPNHRVNQEVELMTTNSELLVCQVQWSPSRSGVFDRCTRLAALADGADDKLVVALEWLDPSRRQLLDEGTTHWSFAEQEVREKFLDTIKQFIALSDPAYFLVGVEVNYLADFAPREFDHFVDLYHQARQWIRAQRPHCKVTVSFQYELFLGHGPLNAGTEETVSAFGDALDVLGISTYPLLIADTPEDIPRNYYEPLSKYGMPVAIFETAWPTSPLVEPDLARLQQGVYLDRTFNAFNRLNAEAVVWTGALDTPAPPEIEFRDGVRWPDHLGLWHTLGDPKPAAHRWRSWLDRPISPLAVATR